jgi:hypothetical protein
MNVYIAGPMTGLPEYNFPAFDRAAIELAARGHNVFNPAQMDRDIGFDPASAAVTPSFLRDAMRRDLSAVCNSDAIAMLPGWEKSGGARVEWMLAVHLGLKVIYLGEASDGFGN